MPPPSLCVCRVRWGGELGAAKPGSGFTQRRATCLDGGAESPHLRPGWDKGLGGRGGAIPYPSFCPKDLASQHAALPCLLSLQSPSQSPSERVAHLGTTPGTARSGCDSKGSSEVGEGDIPGSKISHRFGEGFLVANNANRHKQEREFTIGALGHLRVNRRRARSFGKSGPRQPQGSWKLGEVGFLPRGAFMCSSAHAAAVTQIHSFPSLCFQGKKNPKFLKGAYSFTHSFVGCFTCSVNIY